MKAGGKELMIPPCADWYDPMPASASSELGLECFVLICWSKACLWKLHMCVAQLPLVEGKSLSRRLDSGQLLHENSHAAPVFWHAWSP